MTEKEKQKLERLNARYKRQNNAMKEKYDRVSATLPKGTTDRIKALGLTTNGLINELVLSELERLENAASIEPKQTANPVKDLDFSAYEERKAETGNLQTIEELNAYVLRMQEENAKQPKKELETVGEIIKSAANSDEKPKDDELTNLLNDIRERRAEATKDK